MKVEIDVPTSWVKAFKSLAGILKRADWKQELSWYLKWDECNLLSDPRELAEFAMALLADICPKGHRGEGILPQVIARRALAYLERKGGFPSHKFEEDLIDIWRVEVGEITKEEAAKSWEERRNPPPKPDETPQAREIDVRAAKYLRNARAWILSSDNPHHLPEGHEAEIIPIDSHRETLPERINPPPACA